ncbi:unnamed protein product, partial [Rotaria sordida]
SNTNNITNVIINERCSIEKIKMFVALYSSMEHLAIQMRRQKFEFIFRFILLKTKINIEYLCSLSIEQIVKSTTKIIKNLIESEELLDNYLIKFIDRNLYL